MVPSIYTHTKNGSGWILFCQKIHNPPRAADSVGIADVQKTAMLALKVTGRKVRSLHTPPSSPCPCQLGSAIMPHIAVLTLGFFPQCSQSPTLMCKHTQQTQWATLFRIGHYLPLGRDQQLLLPRGETSPLNSSSAFANASSCETKVYYNTWFLHRLSYFKTFPGGRMVARSPGVSVCPHMSLEDTALAPGWALAQVQVPFPCATLTKRSSRPSPPCSESTESTSYWNSVPFRLNKPVIDFCPSYCLNTRFFTQRMSLSLLYHSPLSSTEMQTEAKFT